MTKSFSNLCKVITQTKRSAQIAMAAATLLLAAAPHAYAQQCLGSWQCELHGRDLDGNLANGFEAYYDDVQDVTWLVNAGFFRGTWDAAHTRASALSPGGITGWRLPKMLDLGLPGCSYSYNGGDCGYNVDSRSEMARLFYITLGNKGYYDISGNGPQAGWGLSEPGPFKNIQIANYWVDGFSEAVAGTFPWEFNFYYGNQSVGNPTDSDHYLWAVHDGDVGVGAAPVPEPETALLAVFGLAAVGLMLKRRA